MKEAEKAISDIENQVFIGKEIEFYSVMLDAWINNSFEIDKMLLNLSVAGIGGLVALVNIYKIDSIYYFSLFFISVFLFVICIYTIINIFRENKSYLEKTIKGTLNQDDVNNPELQKLDRRAGRLFISGLVFALLTGFYASAKDMAASEDSMSKEKNQTNNQSNPVKTTKGIALDSLNLAANLRPSSGMKFKSLNSAAGLCPKPIQSQSTTNTTPSPQGATSGNNQGGSK